MSSSFPGGRPVALVTGANAGIGLATGERLLADGFALLYATRERTPEYGGPLDRLSALGPVRWAAGDLTDPAVPERLVAEAAEGGGTLAAVVSNAGLTLAGPALDTAVEDFDRLFALDVRATLLLARAAAGHLEQAGGSLVAVTSVHEHTPREGLVLYAAAKAALGMLARGLALELAPRGIRVNAVAPGVIATERNEEAARLREHVPAGRPGDPAEVAAAVSFLVSEDARYVTGTSLLVDGGVLQRGLPVAAG